MMQPAAGIVTNRRKLLRTVPLAGTAALALSGVAACGGGRGAAPGAPAAGPEAAAASARTPIALAVSGLEVEDQVQTLPLNFIDRRRSEEMIAEVRRYVGDRLRATGGPDFGKVVFEQASVIEQPRQPIGGIRGALTPEPSNDFVGLLAVRVAVADGLGVEKAYARAQLGLKRPVETASSVMDRDRQARALMRDLVERIDASLETAIRENLGAYLVTS
jgi:hypothetical protein